jgi:hypothetical protein
MKIYFLLWDGLPCTADGFITARMLGSDLQWLDNEELTAMWDSPEEPKAWIKKLRYPSASYKVYEVDV